jgi:AraC-like DNA-binding protein
MKAPYARIAPESPKPTLSMRFVGALADAVVEAGVSRAEFLRATRIDPEQLDAVEARLPRLEFHRICDIALELTQNPALALHWVEGLDVSSFGPISHLIAHSPSLRQALEAQLQFGQLLSDEPYFRLAEHEHSVTLHCVHFAAESRQSERFWAETIVTALFRLVCTFSGNVRPENVSFSYGAPDYFGEYARIFQGAERFEQPFTGIVFARALLDAPSPFRDEGLHDTLQALAERRIARLAQASYAQRVRQLLVDHGGPRRMKMTGVARSLGLSVRSLQRRLASEGKSYSEVESDAFTVVAKRLLGDRRHTIQEAAHAMGFSDVTAFHRAFKRRTGTTPSAYQARGFVAAPATNR